MTSLKKILFLALIPLLIFTAFSFLGGHGPDIRKGDKAEAQKQPERARPSVDFAPVIKKLQPAIVAIKVEQETSEAATELPEGHPDIPPGLQHSEGSGFVIDDSGLILTNNHVVEDAKKIEVVFSNKKKYIAKVKGRDTGYDVALIKIEPKHKLTAAPLGDSDGVKIGEWVIAMGNPLGLSNNVTVGIVSAKKRDFPDMALVDFIQTDAGIYPGSSGGPLVDSGGRAIAVNTAAIPDTKIGMSVPINQIKKILNHLKTKGNVERGHLGAFVFDPKEDPETNTRPAGAFIIQLEPGGPAEKAGLKEEDIITGFNNKPVKNPKDLAVMEASSRPGKTVELKIDRGGTTQAVAVTLGNSITASAIGP